MQILPLDELLLLAQQYSDAKANNGIAPCNPDFLIQNMLVHLVRMKEANKNLECQCHTCIKKRDEGKSFFDREYGRTFIVCPNCGNKRCPHANNHENQCTNSNEIGQVGSAYP